MSDPSPQHAADADAASLRHIAALLAGAEAARVRRAALWVQVLDEGGVLRHHWGVGLPEAWVAAADGIPVEDDRSVAARACAAKSGAVFVDDLGVADCGVSGAAVAMAAGFGAIWAAPMVGRAGELLGGLTLLVPGAGPPEEGAAGLLAAAAGLAASHVEATRGRAELQRAHDRLTFHVDNSPLAVVELDREARIIRWSSQAERALGWTAFEVVGRHAPELGLVHEGDHDRLLQVVQGLVDGARARAVVRGRVRSRDGRILETEWHVSALRDERGHPVSFLGFGQDISQRLRREDALRHTQKLESLGVLAGGIAHEFNNLLTSVMGHAGLGLQSVPADDPMARHLEPIEEAAERGAELTQQLLAYAGKGRYIVRTLDLSDVVAEITDLIAVSVSKKANVRYHLSPEPLKVDGDANQLQQVVLNLVMNASEALEHHEGLVTVSTERVQLDEATITEHYAGQDLEPGPYAQLEVVDTGCGMDPETLARVFDPFFTTRMTGRGLGLAAVAGIVRTHRGGVRIASALRRGTASWVVLPLTPGADDATGTSAIAPTVLVVDDEAAVRQLLGEILGMSGYRVLYAADGLEARSIYRDVHASLALVILDVVMPHMDGVETFKALMEIDQDVPVLLASGYAERQISRRFGRVAPAGFIQKPFRVRSLLAEVERCIEAAAVVG